MQSRQSLHCSRTCTKWVFISHILSVNAQTSFSMRAVSPEPSLLSRMHKMGVHMAYSISECSYAPEHTCSLTRSFTALAHAHKWAYMWHILSANAQNRRSMHAGLSEPSLLSHMHKMGVHMAYSISECSDAPEYTCSLARAYTALEHAHKWAYIWHILSANAQTRSNMHAVLSVPSLLSYMHKMGVHMAYSISRCSDAPETSLLSHMHKMGVHMAYSINKCSDAPEYTCSLARAYTALEHSHKWAYIWHILSANAQTRSNMQAVLSVPSLLSHMHKMGVHMAYSISRCSDAPETSLLSHMHKMGVHMAYSINKCSDAPAHVCSPTRAITALGYAQNGHTYDVFFRWILRRALACLQSRQRIHCSQTCTKRVYIWHILSVNAWTSLSMRSVSPEHSLPSHMHK